MADDTDQQDTPKRQAAKLARQVEANDVRWLMASPQGRRLVHRWIARAGVHRSTFAPGTPDVSAYNEGFRAFGLFIEAEVTAHASDDYLRMLTEALKT